MQQKSKLLNLRLIIACAILIICAIAITSKLISLSVSDGVFLQKEGKKRYIKYRETKAVRGSIYDRNNFPLAISIVNYDLYALSGFNSNKLLSLKNKIDIPSQSLDKKKFLKKTLLKKNISASEHLFIKNLNFNRLEVETRHSRHYPLGDQISPLIGFYGKDGPQEGIEKSYDYLLSGSDGREKLYKNAKQEIISKPIEVLKKFQGKDIVLTIDSTVQFFAYKHLVEAIKNNNAESGSVIILDNSSGEVLAIASYPSYNPNDPMRVIHKNRALVDSYEFGSAIKPIALSIGIENGSVDINNEISTPQRLKINNKIIVDPKNYKFLKPMDIIAFSSQVGASKIALSIGYNDLKNNYLNYGFTKPISINFPSSSYGYMNFKDNISDKELAALGYGYGFEVSPYQLASAYSVFANKGILKDFTLVKGTPVTSRKVISSQSAKYVADSLKAVVEYGTGRKANVKNYQVGGKTSTVHKVASSGYKDDSYRASFVGIAPIQNQTQSVTILVSIDNPNLNAYSGGSVAAPVFSKIAEDTLNYLGYTSDE
jgi:cell division protein FtsI (penicillin-binding protein 3)